MLVAVSITTAAGASTIKEENQEGRDRKANPSSSQESSLSAPKKKDPLQDLSNQYNRSFSVTYDDLNNPMGIQIYSLQEQLILQLAYLKEDLKQGASKIEGGREAVAAVNQLLEHYQYSPKSSAFVSQKVQDNCQDNWVCIMSLQSIEHALLSLMRTSSDLVERDNLTKKAEFILKQGEPGKRVYSPLYSKDKIGSWELFQERLIFLSKLRNALR